MQKLKKSRISYMLSVNFRSAWFQIILVDRSLMPGDVVRRLISGKESQRGFVQNCRIKCHLQIQGTDQFIYNIDAKDLQPQEVSACFPALR